MIAIEGRTKDLANGKGLSAHEVGKEFAECGSRQARGCGSSNVPRGPTRKGHQQAYSCGRRTHVESTRAPSSITPGLVEARPFKWAGILSLIGLHISADKITSVRV